MTERLSFVYEQRAAIYGQTFRSLGCFHGIVLTLLSTGLFRQVLVGHTGDITTVYVAVQRGRADRPFTISLFDIHDGINRNAQPDFSGYLLCIAIIVRQLYISTLRGSLIVCVVLCDLRRVAPRPFLSFSAQMLIQTMLYFAVDGRGSKAEMLCNVCAGVSGIVQGLNTETVRPIETAILFHAVLLLKV